jgi:hypothetical protein
VIRRLACAALVALALTARPTVDAHADDTTTTTITLPVDATGQGVIPLPNSGRAPEAAGDRGGWAQLLLFGLLFVASAAIFGRVLWAGHQRSRANRLPERR